MTEREQLWAAVLAHPADDTLRGAFADWLEEQPTTRVCPDCIDGVSQSECKVCSNTPDANGWIEHGRGCYVLDEDGGGGEPADDCSTCDGTGTVPDTGDRDRAELFRVQVELSHYEEKVTDGDRAEHWWTLKRRVKQLLAAHPDWLRCPCPAMNHSDSYECPICLNTRDLFRSRVNINRSDTQAETESRVLDWHAGWPDAIACTLDEAGAERDVKCGRCGGSGDPNEEDSVTIPRVRVCPGCAGQSTVRRWVPAAWAKAVVAAVPVRKLVPSDREPDPIAREFCWLKSRPGIENGRASLPAAVFDALVGGRRENAGVDWAARYGHDDAWVVYPTREAAVDALARTLAELAWNAH